MSFHGAPVRSRDSGSRAGSINNNNQATAAAAGVELMLTSEEAVAQLRALRERIPEFLQLPNMMLIIFRRSGTVAATRVARES